MVLIVLELYLHFATSSLKDVFYLWNYRWLKSQAKKDGVDVEIAKYDGKLNLFLG